MRSPEKVTQVQGVPINVGSVRERAGEETRCESTGGCEGKQGRPAGDIRSGGTRAQERWGCSRTAAGKESDELRSLSAPACSSGHPAQFRGQRAGTARNGVEQKKKKFGVCPLFRLAGDA